MNWEIKLPFRDCDDRLDLNDLAAMTREKLAGEDAQVARALALMVVTESQCETYGELVDVIENADQPTRRRLLDAAREQAGLPPTAKVDAREAYEAANASPAPSQMRDAKGRVQALCGDPTCRNFKPGEFPGSIAWVDVKRWWCDQHRHLAADGDLEPWRPRIRYSRIGSIEFPDEQEAEAERQRVAAESRRRQREVREAQRREEGARLAELEAARDARFRAERFAGFRP
jgi:hypothetical protein